MMGPTIPGSNELLSLLAALADPEATKVALKELVAKTEAAQKAEKSLAEAQARADKHNTETLAVLAERMAEARVATQKASDDSLQASELLAKSKAIAEERREAMDAREKDLERRAEGLANWERRERDALSVRVSDVTAREEAVKPLMEQATADAKAASEAKELYEGKLAALKAQAAAFAAFAKTGV